MHSDKCQEVLEMFHNKSNFQIKLMAMKRGPSAGPIIREGSSAATGRRLMLAPPSNVRLNNPNPVIAATKAASKLASNQASALAKIHERMRQQAQYEPTIAELSAPKSKQPRNGGMSTKEIIQARLEAKVREREASLNTTNTILV